VSEVNEELKAICEKIKAGDLVGLMDAFRVKPELLKERPDGETFLHLAVMHDKKEIMEFFMLRGIGVNEKNDRGEAPIHKVVSKDALDMLLSRGGDMNAQDAKGRTFIHNGALHNECALVDYLALKGANLNAKTAKGITPLMQAVAGGHLKMIEILIAMGADVNAQDADGDTALHTAVLYENPEVVKMLALHDAKMNVKDSDDMTPLAEAQAKNLMHIARLLMQFGAKE